MSQLASVSTYSLLGRSGLRVSPLCLGAMTFGTEWGWGAPRDTVFALLDRYVAAGGNFVDTADLYTAGTSERLIGEWFSERGNRDRVVLATKYTFGARAGDPNSGGNARRALRTALDASLARLGTDYVDLYWMHAWDTVTPVEEVVRALDEVVSQGKVRYVGFSDTPAWYAARAWTLADERDREKICALQLEYSLIERNIEREHIPLALELGLAITPWSPLGRGMLTGKFQRGFVGADGRLSNPGLVRNAKIDKEKNWAIVDTLIDLARELGRSPAQIALAWVATRPGVTSTIIGATRPEQLEDNLGALETPLPPEALERLEAASRIELGFPYDWFQSGPNTTMSGQTKILAEPRTWRKR